jgi:26S proteasome regulatory subunit N3
LSRKKALALTDPPPHPPRRLLLLLAAATMPEDVQMNDSEPHPAAPPPAAAPAAAAPALSTLHHLKEIASVIEAGSLSKEVRRISRAVRLTVALRRRLAARDVSTFLAFALPASSEAYARLTALVPKEDDTEMDVDAVAPTTQISIKHGLPEIEIFCYLLVLIFLIDQKKYDEAKACATASIARLKNLNRRTVDVLASRLYFYYSYVYELTNSLAEIRGNLLALHRMATLHRDELGQVILIFWFLLTCCYVLELPIDLVVCILF